MTASPAVPPDVWEGHQRRLFRFSCHKRRTDRLIRWLSLAGLLTPRLARLQSCHSWLLFRYEPQAGRLKLANTRSCDLPLLCPLCAIRRAARASSLYRERAERLLKNDPELRLSYAVLTVVNRPDLRERFEHLQKQARLLLARRRAAESVGRGHRQFAYAQASSLAAAVAGAYSFEVKRGANSREWHPHLNLLLLSKSLVQEAALQREWQTLTGDSWIVYCRPRPAEVGTFVEIFKYALKFSDLTPADTWEVYQRLKGRRLQGSFGGFRGLKREKPSATTEESSWSLLYRYWNGEFISDGIGGTTSFAGERFTDCHPQASAQHGIECR